MRYLKQNTAFTHKVGPFLDDTGAIVTTLDIDRADVLLSKNGGALTQKNDTTANAAYDANGFYLITCDATDANTLGHLRMSILKSGALPVTEDFMVLDPAQWEAKFGSGVNNGIGIGIVWKGTLADIDDTTIEFPASNLINQQAQIIVSLTGGTNAAPKSRFATYSGSGEVWTVDPPWNSDGETTPSGTVTAIVQFSPKFPISTVPGVNTLQIDSEEVIAAGTVTFPDEVASRTNITGGVITTVTNLTNAPSAGDFTATMKTSIGTAVAASAVASVTGNVGGNVVGNVGGNVTGSVGSVVGAVGSVTGDIGGLAANAILDVETAVFGHLLSADLLGATFEQYLLVVGSGVAGKSSGLGTNTAVYRNWADDADVITATVDADGNRSAVTISF